MGVRQLEFASYSYGFVLMHSSIFILMLVICFGKFIERVMLFCVFVNGLGA